MASGQIFTDGNFQGVGTDGLIVANGKLYVYDNSTGLLATTYQDSALTITNTNPVILSASGKAKVFLNTGTYDITLKTSTDVEVWTLNYYIADDVYTKSETDSILAARTVGTIAALRATTYSGQTIVSVTGYYTEADNIGVREYYWDSTSTEADNGGTIIQVTGVVTGRWKMKYSGAVNVKWFGAKGDGVIDDWRLIQNTIDYAIQFGVAKVYIPDGNYLTSDTLNIGYGIDFISLHVFGSSPRYALSDNKGTMITPLFNDRPVFNFQGGRNCILSDVTLHGKAYDYINNTSGGLGSGSCTIDDTNVATWQDPLIPASSYSRYAPYAGVSIDAYSGVRPATSYPDVTYPSFYGTVAQYNKASSSKCKIKNVIIRGFAVGVVNQPCDYDANGDFTNLEDVNISHCQYGFSVGNSQSRACNVYGNSIFNQCHTIFTSNTHGKQIGNFGGVQSGITFGQSIQLFKITGDRGALNLNGCYAETIWRLGESTITGTNINRPVSFISCFFNFQLQSTYNTYRGVPKYLIDTNSNSTISFIFKECELSYLAEAAIFNAGFRMVNTKIMPLSLTATTSALKNFRSSTALAVIANINLIRYSAILENSGYGYRYGITYAQTTSFLSWSDNHIMSANTDIVPYFTSSLILQNNNKLVLNTDNFGSYINKASTPITISGLSFTIVNANLDIGDMIIDRDTGVIFYVSSYNLGTTTATCTAINDYVGASIRSTINGSSGLMDIVESGNYYGNQLLIGDTTLGSNIITNVINAISHIKVGDKLRGQVSGGFIFDVDATVTAIDGTAKTITLSRNANQTLVKHVFNNTLLSRPSFNP